MRATGRLCALLCALFALLPASAAQAKITPLPKPAEPAAKPGTVDGRALIAPVSRPATRTVKQVRLQVASRSRPRVHRTVLAPRRGFVLATSRGGRDTPRRVLSSGGGRAERAVTGLLPTRLGFVGAGEALPAPGDPWPTWKLALLTLLAIAEGFVLARIARNGRFARASKTS